MVGGNDGLPLIPQPTRRQRNTPVIAAGAATKAFAVEAAHQVALAQSFLAQVVEPVAELPGNLGAVVRNELFRCAVAHQRDAGECLGGFTAALDLPNLKTLIDEQIGRASCRERVSIAAAEDA